MESVCQQTVLPHEVIVVDDGSTDTTVSIIQKIISENKEGLIKVFFQSNLGPGAARNRGIQESSGNWIAFLDGDDSWLDTKIERVYNAIVENPEVTIIAHNRYDVTENGNEVLREHHNKYRKAYPLLPQLFRRNFLTTSTITVKKEAVINAGMFNTELSSGQDYDLWLKIAPLENLIILPLPLTKYIIRDESISSSTLKRYHCLMRIYRYHAPIVAKSYGKLLTISLYIQNLVLVHLLVLSILLKKCKIKQFFEVLTRFPVEIVNALLL